MKLAEQTLEHWIAQAQKVATIAHQKQTRSDGSPYIAHPTRVAAAVEPRLKPIAFLHDVVEDTHFTIADLKGFGFPSYIVDAVDILTHQNNEPNLQYWMKIKQNPDALAVKLADINDNINGKPSERSKAKYAIASKFFAEP